MGIDTYGITPFISVTIALPLVGLAFLLFVPERHARVHRAGALATSLITFLWSLSIWRNFDPKLSGFQLVEQHVWLPFGASYTVGVDGLSLLLVILTTFITPVTILSTFKAIEKHVKSFYISMLLLETSMVGTLVAMDLLLFYTFWELMLVPMYLIIGIWGGERRVYAAVKFFLYTFLGSVLMLVAIIWLHIRAGGTTFSYLEIAKTSLSLREQMWAFAAFGLAFAIKVPIFPFHTWLPDAHVEAPTAGSVILAGVLLKMGTYGFLRFAIPLFPDAAHEFALPIMVLAVVGIVYGSLVAFAQQDIKRLVAYSSIAHLGFVMLGMFAMTEEAVEGSILQMVNHGISTGALFLLVGVIYERRHTRDMAALGGLARPMKIYAAVLVIITLSSIGLPGTNGFVGEFLILAGTFRRALSDDQVQVLPLAVLATLGIVLGAVYMLTMVRKVLFGPVVHEENRCLKDLSSREFVTLIALVIMVFWIGIFPRFFVSVTESSVKTWLRVARTTTQLQRPLQAVSSAGFEAIEVVDHERVVEAGQ